MPDNVRDTFSLRFKDPRNREALRRLSELTGTPMTVIAEQAIAHEVVLMAGDLERRLDAALSVVRNYTPGRDLAGYIEAAAAGEGEDLGGGLHAVARHAAAAHSSGDLSRVARSDAALDVAAAFAR